MNFFEEARRTAAHRARLGRLGERLASEFLARNGVRILKRNVKVGRGEIDLIAADESGPFVVEVKTGIASEDDHPRFHFTDEKATQVARLARKFGIHRIDLVTVVVGHSGAQTDWHRRVG